MHGSSGSAGGPGAHAFGTLVLVQVDVAWIFLSLSGLSWILLGTIDVDREVKSDGQPIEVTSVHSRACLRTRTYGQWTHSLSLKSSMCSSAVMIITMTTILSTPSRHRE